MKTIIIFFLTLLSFHLSSAAELSDKLWITGFSIVESSKSFLRLKYRDNESFILSLEKFVSEEDAKAFCIEHNLNLDSDGALTTLLLAMSGAASADERILNAIGFELRIQDEISTGIWAWTGKDSSASLMTDGQGSEIDILSKTQLSKIRKLPGMSDQIQIPAICR